MKKQFSIYLSYLLRHHPEDIHLHMDKHGYVSVDELIKNVNQYSSYHINLSLLEEIVQNDEKGRYRFDEHHQKIKACQGHSLPWVEVELEYKKPPDILYHGTTKKAYQKIKKSGAILKMDRHAVHLQSDLSKAWQSAWRWHLEPIVLKIDARKLSQDGGKLGKTDNDVWCIEKVPIQYIIDEIKEK